MLCPRPLAYAHAYGASRGSHGVPPQMLKSIARLGATLLSICAELRALRREAWLSFRELCKIGALRALRRANRRRREKPPKAVKVAEGGKSRRRREKPPKAGKVAEGGKSRRRREKPPKAEKTAEGGKNRRRREKPPNAGNIAEGGQKSPKADKHRRSCNYLFERPVI